MLEGWAAAQRALNRLGLTGTSWSSKKSKAESCIWNEKTDYSSAGRGLTWQKVVPQKRIWRSWQQQHEPAVCPLGKESQQHLGLPADLGKWLLASIGTLWDLTWTAVSSFGLPQYKKGIDILKWVLQRPPRGTEGWSICQTERDGFVQPYKEKTRGTPHFHLKLPDQRL